MSSVELPSFSVGALDVSGITDADLKRNEKRRYLRNPGAYNLEVVEFKLFASDKMKDGAGKQWGSALVTAKDEDTGYHVQDFIAVPLETAIFTSKSGTTSDVKTKIFCNFIESLTGTRPAVADLQEVVAGLPDLLEGGKFTATIGYPGDHLNYLGKDDQGGIKFNILMKDGSAMVDSDGQEVIFNSRDEAIAYYQNARGMRLGTTLGYLSYRTKRVEKRATEESVA